MGAVVVVVDGAEVVVVEVSAGSGSEVGEVVVVVAVVGAVVEVSRKVVVLVVGADAMGASGSSLGNGVGESVWTGSASNDSVLLTAIVVGGSIAVGVSVTWSRTLLTAAEAMSTAATVTASQMSG